MFLSQVRNTTNETFQGQINFLELVHRLKLPYDESTYESQHENFVN